MAIKLGELREDYGRTAEQVHPMYITDHGVTYLAETEEDLEEIAEDIKERAAQREAIRQGHLRWHPRDEPMPSWKRRAQR